MSTKLTARIGATAMTALLIYLLAGCGGEELAPIVHDIAESQGVKDAVVRQALDSQTSNGDAELALAKEWRGELPDRRIPSLENLDTFADYSMGKLKEAACEAIFDMLVTHQVPTGEQFVETYVDDLMALPQQQLQSVIADFDQLWSEAAAGTLQSTDIRLTLMKYQYC